MEALAWILGGGVLMTAIALVGSVTLLLRRSALQRIVLPLVAFSAGSLLGGAFFHMIPAAVAGGGSLIAVSSWVMLGYTSFFALEQFLHWHHCRNGSAACKKPLTYLVLIGDGLHNFIGGLAVAGAFLVDIRVGIAAWAAAAAHEVPQELGDFGVLVHGGLSRGRALALNALSGSMFLLGGLVAYVASRHVDVAFLLPFAAGNFIYIGSSDLVPEVNRQASALRNVVHFAAFIAGLLLLLGLAYWLG